MDVKDPCGARWFAGSSQPPGKRNPTRFGIDSWLRISAQGGGTYASLAVPPNSDSALKTGAPSERVPLPDTPDTWWVQGSQHSPWTRYRTDRALLSKVGGVCEGSRASGLQPGAGSPRSTCVDLPWGVVSIATPVQGPWRPLRDYQLPFSFIPHTDPRRKF